MSREFTLTIRGKSFRVIDGARLPKDICGECDPPDAPGKRIRIKRGLSEFDHLDTAIHEALHAAGWWADEEWVDEVATDIARLLTKLGYKRCDCQRQS